MIEAEYKARLSAPSAVRDRLGNYGSSESVTYRDTYFDDRRRSLTNSGRELRLRTITSDESERHLFTFKEPAVDADTGSKPEYETVVIDRSAMEEIFSRLGYSPSISFSKKCENFRFSAHGRKLFATLVTVPEIDGTFLELETQVPEESDLEAALMDLRTVLAELGVSPAEFTNELYTDAVAKARSNRDSAS